MPVGMCEPSLIEGCSRAELGYLHETLSDPVGLGVARFCLIVRNPLVLADPRKLFGAVGVAVEQAILSAPHPKLV